MVSNIWGQRFSFGPVTFEIYWPPAKDLMNKVIISITNNDTVMWYTMHIFYIHFYVLAHSTHTLYMIKVDTEIGKVALWQRWLINVEYRTSN